jgi:hypothetical protein
MTLNRVLRRIFGPRRDEVTGGWRKLQTDELHDFFPSPIIIRIIKSRTMKWAGHVTQMEKRTVLAGKQDRKRPLGRPRRRWIDNMKVDHVEIGWAGVDWIGLAQDRYSSSAIVNVVMKFRAPLHAGKQSNGCTIDGLSSRAHLHRVR